MSTGVLFPNRSALMTEQIRSTSAVARSGYNGRQSTLLDISHYRQIVRSGAGQTPVHWHIGYERVKISSPVDTLREQQLIQRVPIEFTLSSKKNRKIRIISDRFHYRVNTLDIRHRGQQTSV